MAKTCLYRVTIGQKLTKRFTKWHHFHLHSSNWDSAYEKSESMFRELFPGDCPLKWMVVRYVNGAQYDARKWSYSGKWLEVPHDEFEREQLEFKEKCAKQRREQDKMNEKARIANERWWIQFGDLAQAARDLIAAAQGVKTPADGAFVPAEAMDRLLDAANRVSYV